MNGRALVTSDQPAAEEGTTMRLYHPLTSYDEAVRVAANNLSLAVARGDEVAMKQCFDEITFYEQRIREQAQMVRKHLVAKAEGRMQKAEGGQHG